MNKKRTIQKVTDDQKVLEIGNEQTIKLDGNKSIENQIKNLNFDTQVKVTKQKAPKRKFSNAYKLQILNALDVCKNGDERAALLRKEGLYYARISLWKKQFQNGKFASNKTPKSILLTQKLTREVASLKKKLSQAEAIIDLQKKVSELLSISILDQDTSEM
jgi:transposase